MSTHLVTDREPIKTESFNLNFIFSKAEDLELQLAHIYSLLPYLLCYSVDIIETALQRISHLGEDNLSFRRYLGLLAWVQEYFVEGNLERTEEIKSLLKDLTSSIDSKCEKCGKKFKLDKEQMMNICFGSCIKCSKCKETIEIT
jgi:Mg2+ and Co2+ transporter CorA